MCKKKRKDKKQTRRPSSRVFFWAIDNVAFIDRLTLSIAAKLKQSFGNDIIGAKSRGIFRFGSLYSRCITGKCAITGNPVTILHGRTRKFSNVPQVRITFHSERIPLTGAQVTRIVHSLTRKNAVARVATLELTFDLADTTTSYIFQHLVHRARGDVRVVV